MGPFQWDETFLTGLSDVDVQHRHLVGLVNQLGSLIIADELRSDHIDSIVKELSNYSVYHFEEEERLMKLFDVDDRHQNRHITVHKKFLAQAVSLVSGITDDDVTPATRLYEYLSHWLVFHILGDDQNMARQIEKIREGLPPDRAFEEEEKESDRSKGPLLVALSGLFEIVSSRNKELLELNNSLELKIAERTRELTDVNRHLEDLCRTDALTGLPNRRHAMKNLGDRWTHAMEHNDHLSCMMIDADHFKQVNDEQGHDAGDRVLQELARTLSHSLRNDDEVSRLGGDEFFVVCPKTDLAGCLFVAEVLRSNVSKLKVPIGNRIWNGSISIGVATKKTDMRSYEDLVKEADNGVNLAKKSGKNCVKFAA